ncbi:hypothetical protein ZIOFF_044347 [Zingiber officinale]|uniref:Dynamin N-terminal domain-containing protein n=1 Tax=Zingiber officinale TaxID=94328 RepID=A0A8J5KZV4_ZINOF|nr:hypothetical protein ZIOFF_044347 [Zingiber officinale]
MRRSSTIPYSVLSLAPPLEPDAPSPTWLGRRGFGGQPSDIKVRIRTMIFSSIKQKACIMLAVSPANADLANSDALQMARLADPDGSFGVITKLDIMDRDTGAQKLFIRKYNTTSAWFRGSS